MATTTGRDRSNGIGSPNFGDHADAAHRTYRGDRRQFVGGDDRTGGVGGAGDDHAGRRRVDGRQRRGGQLEAALGPAGNLHRNHVQGAQRIAIGDVARPGQGDAVAGREAGGQGQHQGGRGAAGEDELVRLDRDAIGLVIVPGEPGLQRRAFPIAYAVAVEHAVRGGDRRARRAGRRLAELHMQDRPAFRLEGMGEATDGDGLEGCDFRGHGRGGGGNGVGSCL